MYVVMNCILIFIIIFDPFVKQKVMTTYICLYKMYVVMNCLLIFIILFDPFVKQKVNYHY